MILDKYANCIPQSYSQPVNHRPCKYNSGCKLPLVFYVLPRHNWSFCKCKAVQRSGQDKFQQKRLRQSDQEIASHISELV